MRRNLTIIALFFLCGLSSYGQSFEFTYQGSLNVGTPPNTTPANTAHDFEFRLFTAESGGSQLGGILSRPGVSISNGIFSVKLDFGNQFQGVARWLEIRVKPAGGPAYTLLNPRQKVSPTPESIFSLNSDMLGGVAANQYLTTTTGNANFIQNSTSQQFANFNISGSGHIANQLGVGTATPVGKLQVVTANDTAPSSVAAWDARHFVIGGTASSGGIGFSYDQTNNVGYVSSLSPNVLWRNLVLQAGGGNVGIGTTSPAASLSVRSFTANTTDNTATFLAPSIGPIASHIHFGTTGDWYIRSAATNGKVVMQDTGGMVGIGTSTPATTLEVNGFTKLGSDAPSIKVKKLTGTTSATDGQVSIPHGVDNSKILSVSVMVNFGGSAWIGPSYLLNNGYHFTWRLDTQWIHVNNISNQSALIVSKPIKILITYEQ